MSSLIILVSGLPATGKSALASEVAERFGLPLVRKDDFKEAMYEALFPEGEYEGMDREFQMRLGQLSNASLAVALERLAAAGASGVFESNFDRRLFSPVLARIHARHRFYAVQAHLTADGEELVRRFSVRETDGTRHPGHQGMRDMERIAAVLRAGDEPLDLPEGETFRFDTTDFSSFRPEPFFEAIRRSTSRP